MYSNSKACGSRLVTSKTNGNASIPRSLLCTIQNFLTRQRVPISTFECLERPMNKACTINEAVGYGQRKLWTFCGKRIEIINVSCVLLMNVLLQAKESVQCLQQSTTQDVINHSLRKDKKMPRSVKKRSSSFPSYNVFYLSNKYLQQTVEH